LRFACSKIVHQGDVVTQDALGSCEYLSVLGTRWLEGRIKLRGNAAKAGMMRSARNDQPVVLHHPAPLDDLPLDIIFMMSADISMYFSSR
jgi:hypothetical protein